MFTVYSSIRRFTLFSIICTSLTLLQCALYALFTRPFSLGLAGIPVADLIYYALALLVLLVVLRWMRGPIGLRAIFFTGLRVLAATVAGSALAGLGRYFFPLGEGMLGGVMTTVVYGGGALVVILTLCQLMRVPEMAILTDLLRRVNTRLRGG
jgi:putative peptidoglycan lipid II flippase